MNSAFEIDIIILALSELKGIGSVFVKKNLSILYQYHRWLDSSSEKSLKNLLSLVNKSYSDQEIQDSVSRSEAIFDTCKELDIEYLSITNPAYPKQLIETKDPPPFLFYIGNPSLLKLDAVTVIGTRHPNENGMIIAERVGRYFSMKGWAICNGVADGIDTASIIDSNGDCFADVIGVVGSGLARSSFKSLPRQSVYNIDQILARGGLILSEMPPEKKQDTFSVVKSCRIQAGIGKGTLLIQSSLKGGSRFTVKAAVDSGRPLGIIHPLKADLNLENYSANKAIIERGLTGLKEFIQSKSLQSYKPGMITLSSKDSYPLFEDALYYEPLSLVF